MKKRGSRKPVRQFRAEKNAKRKLKKLEWLLAKSVSPQDSEKEAYVPPYGDATELNNCRLIMDSMCKDTLKRICEDTIDLLDTSVAVYEVNGDYAFGMFSSSWCRLLDTASWRLCGARDLEAALVCGRWLCHENCWNDSAKAAILSRNPTDIECVGGIRLYGVPICAGDEVIGAINMGYKDPPSDMATLSKLAERFDIPIEKLRESQKKYASRPPYIIALAKKRLQTAAKLIGEIVERKRGERALREGEAQKQAIFDGITTNIAFVNEKLEIIWVNKTAAASVGRSPDKMIGHPCHEFWADPEKPCDNCPTLKAFQTRQSEHVTIVTPDGRIWDEKGEPVFDSAGNLIGVVEIAQDITARKRAEDQLKLYSERLEEMVAERTLELERAQQDLLLKERLAVLGNLSGSISHELRNPLGVIDTSVYFLKMKIGDTDEKVYGHLERISVNINKANGIIESLLNLTRMEKPKTRPYGLVILADNMLQSKSIPRTIRIETIYPEKEIFAEIDDQQIRIALKNIIRNAIQAMDGVGTLSVEIRLAEACGAAIVISDTGSGIGHEDEEKIFLPLFSTKVHGIGFGLSIAKMIIEKHGGELTVASAPGGGAAFTALLPLAWKEERKK